MTTRQREFCRHYLAGKSAPAAARAAGYAATTAEKNAAAILSSDKIARRLERARAAAALVSVSELAAGKERMLKIIAEGDDRAAAQAFHALLRLKRLEPALAAQQIAQQTTQENEPQQAEDQQNEAVEETDELDSGHPAFDKRIAPIKPDIVKPLTPIHISFQTLDMQRQEREQEERQHQEREREANASRQESGRRPLTKAPFRGRHMGSP